MFIFNFFCRIVVSFLILFNFISLAAQESLPKMLDVPCSNSEGRLLTNAWVGGLNNPQFSSFDFNKDGLMDLFVFDKLGSVVMIFLRNAEGEYRYSPELSQQFPEFPTVKNFALLRDYNKDGIPDIFTYHSEGSFGIKVLRGEVNEQGIYSFSPLIYEHSGLPVLDFFDPSLGYRRITIPSTDIPVIDDINNDGYLDILSFDAEGLYVRYFKNRGSESEFGLDSLGFVLEDRCWGKFFESEVNDQVTLSPDPNLCPFGLGETIEFRHPGGTLSVVEGETGLKDLLLSDINVRNVKYLKNGGNLDRAWIVDQVTNFPTDFPVDLPTFPATFSVQLDNLFLPDMLVSPNISGFVEDVNVVWQYHNNQNADPRLRFDFVRDDFLVNSMLDFGTKAMPVFADVTGNGLLDIVVGVQTRFDPSQSDRYSPRLYLLKNIGTKESPEFILDQEDWLGLSALATNSHSFVPCFGDVDNDGDLDLIIGDNLGKLYFLENVAGEFSPMEFALPIYNAFGISTGSFAAPSLADIDGDGKLDLLIGERLGKMTLFTNISTPESTEFKVSSLNGPNGFSDIDVRIPGSGPNFAAPRVFTTDKGNFLMVGRRFGGLSLYEPTGTSGLYALAEENYGQLIAGEFLGIDLADLNNNGRLEMIVGNARGGITIYETPFNKSLSSTFSWNKEAEGSILVYPNPGKEEISVDCSDFLRGFRGNWSLYSPFGIPVLRGAVEATEPLVILRPGGLPPGVYIFEITGMGKTLRKKIGIQ
jgi:hypothetical protein